VLPYIEGDVVITFSPDGNSIAELIPELVNKMKEGYDMVIVSRYLNEAKSEDDDIITAFGNWLFTKTVIYFTADIIPMQWLYSAPTRHNWYVI
jgi:hypothetical protein